LTAGASLFLLLCSTACSIRHWHHCLPCSRVSPSHNTSSPAIKSSQIYL